MKKSWIIVGVVLLLCVLGVAAWSVIHGGFLKTDEVVIAPPVDIPALQKAADAGDGDAMDRLGLAYMKGQDVEKNEAKAVALFRKATEQGNVDAMRNLGNACLNGRGIGQNPDLGIEWLRTAAASGSAEAMCNLGFAYLEGDVVTKDETEGVRWLQEAARHGNDYARKKLEDRGVKW